MHWSMAANFFIALLAIVNPLGKLPLWLRASTGEHAGVRWRLAALLTATGFGVLLIFLVAGEFILALFGIDLASFRIGGGVVIMLIGINMLNGRAVVIEHDAVETSDSPYNAAITRFRQVVVPLSVPMIAGPGAISTTIIYGAHSDSPIELALLGVIVVLVAGVVLAVLLASDRIHRVLGDTALNVLTRLFGLILTAIAAQLIVEGLAEVFPNWINENSQISDNIEKNRDPSSE